MRVLDDLRVVFDDVIELRLNEARGIQLRTDERFEVTLTEYTEFVSGGKPFVSVDIDLRTPDDGVYVDVGTGSLPQGVRVWGGSWLGPGRDQIRSEHWEAVVFPTHEPKVFRVRLVGHQAKAKKDRG
jgi:hypothetical protein